MSVPNLNLINFEHPSSKCSEYILTSPKSLKACQKAGVKPVELLYRSLADVRRDVGKKDAQSTYEMLEKERQEKLEKCRKIRNELLMQGYPHCTSSSYIKDPYGNSLREHHSNRSSPRSLLPTTGNNSVPHTPQERSRSSMKSGESPEGNPKRNENSRVTKSISRINTEPICGHKLQEMSSPFPAVKKIEEPPGPASDEVIAKPAAEVHKSPLPPLSTASNSPEDGIFSPTDQSTPKAKSTPKTRKKYVRSHSLPSRPETPNTKPVKAFSRNSSSLGNYEGKSSTDMKGEPKRSSSRNSVSLASIEPTVIDRKPDHHVSFEDINNNHFKAPMIIMRPSSSRKMRQMERRKLMECKKVFDKIQAQYKDPEYCLLKYRQIIENSIERELREQEVRKVQRKIEEGFEMWQDRVLMLQWLDNERAEEQITRNLTTKIERMKQKHRNKEIIHSINMNKVKEEDDIKAEILRRELEKKERKIQVLHEEKERVICESKSRAQAVSELKEQIRYTEHQEYHDSRNV